MNQVIAAEDKGYFLGFHIGIDYNRGPKTRFIIKTRQKQVGFSLSVFLEQKVIEPQPL